MGRLFCSAVWQDHVMTIQCILAQPSIQAQQRTDQTITHTSTERAPFQADPPQREAEDLPGAELMKRIPESL